MAPAIHTRIPAFHAAEHAFRLKPLAPPRANAQSRSQQTSPGSPAMQMSPVIAIHLNAALNTLTLNPITL
jgi:hypothetical protein